MKTASLPRADRWVWFFSLSPNLAPPHSNSGFVPPTAPALFARDGTVQCISSVETL